MDKFGPQGLLLSRWHDTKWTSRLLALRGVALDPHYLNFCKNLKKHIEFTDM
jgi:hypothetical protein